MKKKEVINKKKQNQKNVPASQLKFVICLLFIIASIVLMGTSYARYTTSIEGNKKIRLKTTTFDIVFDDGNEFISLTNEGPMSDLEGLTNDPYTFTIQNNSDLDAVNNIHFTNLTSTIPDEYLKIAYRVGNGSFSEPMTLAELNSDLNGQINGEQDLQTGEIVPADGVLEAHHTRTYTIVLWVSDQMSNSVDNNSLMNTSFSAKVTVTTTQYVEEEEQNQNS